MPSYILSGFAYRTLMKDPKKLGKQEVGLKWLFSDLSLESGSTLVLQTVRTGQRLLLLLKRGMYQH